MTASRRNPGEDDSFVVAALHRHLKEQLAAATASESQYDVGKRFALLDALGFLDGVSDGRYPSEGGAQ